MLYILCQSGELRYQMVFILAKDRPPLCQMVNSFWIGKITQILDGLNQARVQNIDTGLSLIWARVEYPRIRRFLFGASVEHLDHRWFSFVVKSMSHRYQMAFIFLLERTRTYQTSFLLGQIRASTYSMLEILCYGTAPSYGRTVE